MIHWSLLLFKKELTDGTVISLLYKNGEMYDGLVNSSGSGMIKRF